MCPRIGDVDVRPSFTALPITTAFFSFTAETAAARQYQGEMN
jgi:hypothetical protein